MTEVIIVGAGVVGLSAALALLKRNFKVMLIEASEPAIDTRVVALTRATENFFIDLGVWPLISQHCCAYQKMKIWDSVQDGVIHFSAADFFEPNLGYIVEQSVIKAALWQAINAFSGFKLLQPETVVSLLQQEAEITLGLQSGQTLSGKLVIVAEGAASKTRALAGITSKGWDYHQSAIVATVKGEKDHAFTAFQRFAKEGPLALLPLAQPDLCSIVWTSSPETAQHLMQLPPQDFAKVLSREIDWMMGEMSLVSEPKVFSLKTHHATTYATARCVLVGDAAHTIHPLAGQGVNLGFLDVSALVNLLAKYRHRDIGSISLLKRYERQRRFHNQIMIWAMESFKRGFGSQNQLIQWLRNRGLNWVDGQHSVKHFFVKMALGK